MDQAQSKGYIYLITNLVNGKRYVGQSYHCVLARFKRHAAPSSQDSMAICRAMKKHGVESFSIASVECALRVDLNERERFWIKEFGTLSPNGYNLNTGGGNASPSEETRRKLSEIGKTIIHTAERNAKISRALTGKIRTEESKAKQSRSRMGIEVPHLCKPVTAVNQINGEQLQFKSDAECARHFGVCSQAVNHAVRDVGRTFQRAWLLHRA